jgi:hypothetical protein
MIVEADGFFRAPAEAVVAIIEASGGALNPE